MKKVKILFLCSFSFLTVFSSADKRCLLAAHEKDSLPWITYHDLSYGQDEQQKMDLYLPAVRNSKTRTMIIIHGGGWYQGDKSEFDSVVYEFRKRLPDFSFANINYRLVRKTRNYFPVQENDVIAAIAFLKHKATTYNISADYILFGQSAGAQMALLQGYKHSDKARLKGIISFFGPVDLPLLYEHSDSAMSALLQNNLQGTPKTNPGLFASSSPVNFINPHAAPTILFHGDNDHIIPLEQAQALRDKLVKAGVKNRLVIYPGEGHGWTGDILSDSFDQAVLFIKALEK